MNLLSFNKVVASTVWTCLVESLCRIKINDHGSQCSLLCKSSGTV